jgi:hypothetical protein
MTHKYAKIWLVFCLFVLISIAFFVWDRSVVEVEEISFANEYIEKAITDYLVTQEHFAWQTQENSSNFCSIENLSAESDLFPLHVWAYCQEYIFTDGQLKGLSGISVPVKIDYPNELSFYDINRFSYQAPGDGGSYSAQIKEMFPIAVQKRIINFDSKNIIKKNETAALDWFNALNN